MNGCLAKDVMLCLAKDVMLSGERSVSHIKAEQRHREQLIAKIHRRNALDRHYARNIMQTILHMQSVRKL